MPGSATRRQGRASRPGAGDLFFVALVLGLAVLWPILDGGDLARTLVITVLSAGAGVAVCALPGASRVVGFVLVGVGSVVLVMVVYDRLPELLSTFFGYCGGCALGMSLLPRPTRSVKATAAAAAEGAGPGGLLLWEEGRQQFEQPGPGADAVLAAVAALDGRARTIVSVIAGTGRLDVAGDAAGPMMVYHCDDHTDERVPWHHLGTPGAGDAQVEVTVAGVVGHFRRHQTCALPAARAAVAYFVRTHGRDPELPWHGGRDVVDMRPPTLQATD